MTGDDGLNINVRTANPTAKYGFHINKQRDPARIGVFYSLKWPKSQSRLDMSFLLFNVN